MQVYFQVNQHNYQINIGFFYNMELHSNLSKMLFLQVGDYKYR